MKMNLNKKDLINMVRGVSPNYSVMNDPLIGRTGYYIGGHSDTWHWNSELEDLSEVELIEVYEKCKKSWK